MSANRSPRTVWRIGKGCLIPYDSATHAVLRAKGYRIGDVVSADLRKPRNPKFNALAHKFGEMVADNVQAFEGMDDHAVLKRLQWEGNIACEEMGVVAPGLGACVVRIPKSLSFESMDDGEFAQVYEQFCAYVAKTYWTTMTAEAIAEAGRFYEGQR